MKKKIIITILIVCIILLGWLGYELYAYYHPDCGFKVGVPNEETDMYIETLSFAVNEKSIFGAPKELWEKSAEVLDGAYEIRAKILDRYTSPMHITVTVKEENNQTLVTYEGTGTSKETGKEEAVTEQIRFDYTVTQ